MKTVLFEDEHYLNLLPLVYLRPVWELRCGARMLQEKLPAELSRELRFLARDYLAKDHLPTGSSALELPEDEAVLLLNGRWLLQPEDVARLKELGVNDALVNGDSLLACRARAAELQKYHRRGVLDSVALRRERQLVDHPARIVNYLWDAIAWNGEEMVRDYREIAPAGQIASEIPPGVHLLNRTEITVGKNVRLKPGVVIDAENGPVWIDDRVTVMANAVLEGPLFVGAGSTIKIGAKIYENTTIGPVCKIGGEVEGVIVQGYANKQHDGFLGHAYLGAWVNLGADTNNSDLKNNYGLIKAFVNGRPVDTGQRFLGLMMGDHSKSAINTMFNTGTIVGVNSNIFGAGFPQKFVPSFSWGGSEQMSAYEYDKALEVARIVTARRKIDFSEGHARIFRAVWELAKQVEEREY
ncbi:MAG: transferase [Calditrichae bacterium]|nr:transferase [Calditrichia bacterium]